MFRFFVLFMVLLVGLFSLRITKLGTEWVTVPFTGVLADISAFLIKLFDKDVVSYGVIIQSQSTGFAVQIAPGCDGIEAVIILVSAILAFPAPWKHRLVGIGIGFVAIQALNLVRIISLFYLGQWNQTWFDWFHLYLWQALIVLDALAVWLVWLRYLPRRRPPAAPPAGGAAQPA
jgi:exosortase H (IPTLxxWG-CTERM-specific)